MLDEDYPLATVVAIIALEVALYNFAIDRGEQKGISRDNVEEIVKKVGLSLTLDAFLKLLLRDGEPEPDVSNVRECSGAITIRNKVVHRGLRVVLPAETQNRIVAIEKMISDLRSRLSNVSSSSLRD
jgi:3-methyladenine DNA glycosylase/8-oxoguanine DNA glycosylase